MRKQLRLAITVVPLFLAAGCPQDNIGFPDFPVGLARPEYGPTVLQDTPPPPLSGGTMAILPGDVAVAADPDRDLVYVVDLQRRELRATVTLSPRDEPGRVVGDGAGRAHVALRNGGAVVTIDTASGQILERRAVCPTPRGLAWQQDGDLVHVACSDGQLVSLPAAGGAARRTLQLERDLRDVVVDGDHLLVSRFKTADLVVLDSAGAVEKHLRPAKFQSDVVRSSVPFEPAVAWRTVAMPGGGALMLHQRAFTGQIPITPPVDKPPVGGSAYGGGGGGGFGGGCTESIVHATVTRLGRSGSQLAPSALVSSAVVPVDMALSPDGQRLAIVAAGNYKVVPLPQVIEVPVEQFSGETKGCVSGAGRPVGGQATAVGYTSGGSLVVQLRDVAAIEIDGARIDLRQDSREDTGHVVFHANTGQDIACASCHPEGGEDGRVWTFSNSGPRRTQSFRGGVLGTEPLHWDGDMSGLDAIFGEVFMNRMGGPRLAVDQAAAMSRWINSVPLLPTTLPRDPAAVERGRQLYNDPAVACASCHSGEKLTNNESVDVGTSGRFQVPSLRNIAFRAPFLHTGCAPTLTDRFDPACGGAAHGSVSGLSSSQIADLVSYLETL